MYILYTIQLSQRVCTFYQLPRMCHKLSETSNPILYIRVRFPILNVFEGGGWVGCELTIRQKETRQIEHIIYRFRRTDMFWCEIPKYSFSAVILLHI